MPDPVLCIFWGTASATGGTDAEERAGTVACFHSSSSLQEVPLLIFSHPWNSHHPQPFSTLLWLKWRLRFQTTSNPISLSVRGAPGVDGCAAALLAYLWGCLYSSESKSNATQICATQRSKEYCSGGPEQVKRDDGNHVMLQHFFGIVPSSPKYLEELWTHK